MWWDCPTTWFSENFFAIGWSSGDPDPSWTWTLCWYHLVMTNSSPWKITMLLIGKPSISMGHGFHGYVTNNQMVYLMIVGSRQKWLLGLYKMFVGSQPKWFLLETSASSQWTSTAACLGTARICIGPWQLVQSTDEPRWTTWCNSRCDTPLNIAGWSRWFLFLMDVCTDLRKHHSHR